jgi:hypothetical protein
VRDYLNNTVRNTWIGTAAPKRCAPRSPVLIPLGLFAWCLIKSTVPDPHELRQHIYEAVQALTLNMLRDDFRAAVERWAQCREMEGRQVELY